MSHTHHHPMHLRGPESASGVKDKLHVIAVVSNPVRYSSRYELFRKFQADMAKEPLVELHIVEQGFGRRPFEIIDQANPKHVGVRTYEEIWHKENMINIGVQRLPSDWKYVAWIDADIKFQRDDWVTETLQQLQHYMVVQMWQTAIDLGPYNEALQPMHEGFVSVYLSGKKVITKSPYGYGFLGHPGYAWAMRREAWDALGGLYEHGILGAGDHMMAFGLIGVNNVPPQMSPNYIKSAQDWVDRAKLHIHRDIGFVPGSITHYYHGTKANRGYASRWKILQDAQFDPLVDIKKDWQGLYQLDMDGSARMIKLRDDIRAYFRSRNEDSY
jgi:hypothetical protein